jgi:hypothetical protein
MNKCPLCYGYLDRITALEKENEILRAKARTVHSSGWKGKDELIFEKIGKDWHVKEHRKDKDTDKVTTLTHTVSEDTLMSVWKIIESLAISQGAVTRYRELVPEIIKKFNLDVEMEEFNGGINRSTVYFRYYYYPMKILERLNFIHYGGRGKITRLK